MYMMKLAKLIWSKRRTEVFLSSVIFSREELDVFELLIRGIPYEEIAEQCNCSVKKVNELNKIIKAKYRVAQLENPDVLEPLPE
mgnify:FL=1